MRPRSASVLVLGFALLTIAAAEACNNQGQGDVCDVNAGNAGTDDCQTGLTCVPAPGAVGTPNPYRCCPTTDPTAAVCMVSTVTGDASAAPPPSVDASGDVATSDVAVNDAAASDAAPSDASPLDSAATDGAAADGGSGSLVEAAADAAPDTSVDAAED